MAIMNLHPRFAALLLAKLQQVCFSGLLLWLLRLTVWKASPTGSEKGTLELIVDLAHRFLIYALWIPSSAFVSLLLKGFPLCIPCPLLLLLFLPCTSPFQFLCVVVSSSFSFCPQPLLESHSTSSTTLEGLLLCNACIVGGICDAVLCCKFFSILAALRTQFKLDDRRNFPHLVYFLRYWSQLRLILGRLSLAPFLSLTA